MPVAHAPARSADSSTMRRRSSVVLLAVALMTAQLAIPQADAAPIVVASFQLDVAPSWQTSAQRASMGSWVKHSSPVVANFGKGRGLHILVAGLGGKLYALKYINKKLVKAWDSGSGIGTFIDSSPAVHDLNQDGCPEVIVGAGNEFHKYHSGVHVFNCNGRSRQFWPAPQGPRSNHIGVFSTPAVGDVDGNGWADVVYGSFNEKIYVKNGNGKDLKGWPRANYDTVWSSPALADLNSDKKPEIVIGTDLGGGAPVFGCQRGIRGTISVFYGTGAFRKNFPKCMSTPIWSSPAIQDVNGDGVRDIVAGTNNYKEGGRNVGDASRVRAWDTKTGKELWHTLLGNGSRVFSSPAVGDVGADGTIDVAFGTVPATNYGRVYLLNGKTGGIRWSREGGHKSSCECKFMGSPVIADVDGDGKAEVIALSQNGGLNAWDEKGNAVIFDFHAPPRAGRPDWDKESFMFFNSPAVADLDGDGKSEIVMASAITGSNPRRGKVWVVSTPGKGDRDWPFFKRTANRVSALK